MGRPKDFPSIYGDLLAKHKSKGIAEKEYKELLSMAREQGLSKEARLVDVDTTIVPTAHLKEKGEKKRHSGAFKNSSETKHPPERKQRVSGGFSNSEKELYERLVDAERQRAEAEKARGDDLREIAMALASGKKEVLVIPSSPAVDDEPAGTGNIAATTVSNAKREERTKQKHDKLRTLAGVAAGVGGSATKSHSKKGGGMI